ncbi:MAG: TRAP transporter permease [Deltaproteobacteria bacterium]|nr:TRAP transporter permease [Deltaproteobacteria bacterium]MBW1962968.1 TRAP transporter permease [Deltaproteobacteria bacterium]
MEKTDINHNQEVDEGAKIAEKIAEEAELGLRRLSGAARYIIPCIAAAWSLFQLSLPQVLILDSVYVRCIHLAFAIMLVYLSYPAFKKIETKGIFSFLSVKNRIHFIDYGLGIIAACAALYLAINYEQLAERQGIPILTDIIVGVVLVVLLLEAARRSLGPFLIIVACLFIFYSFFGPYMPDVIAFKGVSFRRFMSQMTISTEGIYGIPLDVSAMIVFLFVLFGSLLNKAGGGKYFIDLAFSLLGRFKGGPAKAAVLASGMTGLVSGSSIANTVTTGTFTIPLMKSVGYPDYKAGAIEVAASTNGQLMPPIMGAAAFIIAEYCNLPYLEVVRAAFIPAIISYIALIYITHLEASKLGLKGLPKDQIPHFFKTLFRGLHFLIPMFYLIYELMILRHSPQLAAYRGIQVLAVLIVLQNLIRAYIAKESLKDAFKLSLRQLWDALVAGGRNMMGIGVAVSTAGIIVGVVAMGLGGLIVEVIDTIARGNLVLLLIITAIASLILGMGLPTTANYIVMASLTVPVIIQLGQDYGLVIPAIAAHLFCFFFGILADDTPPVGLAAYAASAIAKSDPIRTGIQGFTYDIRTAILPFMFVFNTDLLLINVTSWWHGVVIFVTGVLAMFAFAALTQNFFIAKNRIYEAILLAGVALMVLRPQIFMSYLHFGNTFVWYTIGLALFGFTYLIQLPRVRAMARKGT